MLSEDILFFLCLNDRGGAEISMLTLAQGMAQRGRRVTLAVYGAHPEFARYGARAELARDYGFTGEIIDLAAHRTVAALLPLLRLLRTRRFDTVISALPYTNIAAVLAVLLLIFSLKKSPRLFVTEHGIEGLYSAKKYPLFAFALRLFYARATGVVAVSQKLAQRWRAFLPSHAAVTAIYNPVVPDAVPEVIEPAHAWLTQKEIPTIIGIGRLKSEKNFALLIRAFARLATQRPVRLMILGEGEQRPMLERLARELAVDDKILLPGFQKNIAAWLPYAALFVSASNREGFGNALVEALMYGVPVVATDCPYGPAEILQDGHYGRLVQTENVEALARAMVQALETDADKQLLRARAADFTAARCIDAYLSLVDN